MNILVVVANPSRQSLSRAVADRITQTLNNNGHDVRFHDLYEEQFDPILPAQEIPPSAQLSPLLQQHTDELAGADGVVIAHPVWWGQPPAILKGWIDRVFRVNVAYRFEEGEAGIGVPVGMLKAETALVVNTSNTPIELERQLYGDSLATFWNKHILGFCGIKGFQRRLYSPVIISMPAEREAWLLDAEQTANNLFPRAGMMRETA